MFKIDGKYYPAGSIDGVNYYISFRMKKLPENDPNGKIVDPRTAYENGLLYHPRWKNYDIKKHKK